nr:TIR domain-containing protein [uncultured Bacteroides sp.]
MVRKKVFVSYDHENDRQYRHMLEEWNTNPDFEFCFSNLSPNEVKKENIMHAKEVITGKIKETDYMFVITGRDANKVNKFHEDIGYRNWQNFEIAVSKANNKKLAGIKLDKKFESPEEIVGCGVKSAMSFTKEAILKALKDA